MGSQLDMFHSGEHSQNSRSESNGDYGGLERVIELSDYFQGGRPSDMQRPGLLIEGSYIDDTAEHPEDVAEDLISNRNLSGKRFITHKTPSGYNDYTEPGLLPYFYGQAHQSVNFGEKSQTRAYIFGSSGGVHPVRYNKLERNRMKPYNAEVVETMVGPLEDYFLEITEESKLYRISELEVSEGRDERTPALSQYHDELETVVSHRLSAISNGSNINIGGAVVGEPYRRDNQRLSETEHQVLAPVLYLFGGLPP